MIYFDIKIFSSQIRIKRPLCKMSLWRYLTFRLTNRNQLQNGLCHVYCMIDMECDRRSSRRPFVTSIYIIYRSWYHVLKFLTWFKDETSLYLMKFSLNNAYATGLSTSSINHVVFLQGWTISIKHSTLIVKRTKIFKYPYWNKYLFGLLCILLFLLNKTLGKIYLYLF